MKRTQNSQTDLRKNEAGKPTLPEFKRYCQAQWGTATGMSKRSMEQTGPEIDPLRRSADFWQRCRISSVRESYQQTVNNWISLQKETNLDSYLTPYTTLNSTWILDPKIHLSYNYKTKGNIFTTRRDKDFFRQDTKVITIKNPSLYIKIHQNEKLLLIKTQG